VQLLKASGVDVAADVQVGGQGLSFLVFVRFLGLGFGAATTL
jgi:hypothetical protein